MVTTRMGNAAPASHDASRPGLQFWLGLAGMAIAIAIIAALLPLWPAGLHTAEFAGWMIVSTGGGFAFRVLRRKLFFAGRLSLHKSFSFDALFQAAILINPQLRYPDVESEFLACQTNTTPDTVSPWFLVREAAAVAIPLALASVT